MNFMKKNTLKIGISTTIFFFLFFFYQNNLFSQSIAPIPYLKGQVWGFCDFNKRIIIEPQYNFVSPFHEGFAIVRKETKYGMINETGKVVIPIEYTNVTAYSNGISFVQNGDNYGGFDTSGKIIVPFSPYYMKDISNRVAIADSSYNYGLLTLNGERLTDFKYGSADRLNDNLIRVLEDASLGIINNTGKVILPSKYSTIDYFYNGFSRVNIDKKWGFINSNGIIVIDTKFDDIGNFNSCNVASYKSDNKWGLIDSNGKYITEPIYDAIGDGNNFGFDFNSSRNKLIKASLNGKVGWIDSIGNVIVPFKYEMTGYWNGGYCPVYLPRKSQSSTMTIINSSGTELFPPVDKYNYVGEYSEGLMTVGVNGYKQTLGYIDTTGREIIPLQFEEASKFKNGIAIVKKDGFFGLINREGNPITKFKYFKLTNSLYYSDVFEARVNGVDLFINSKGVEYFE